MRTPSPDKSWCMFSCSNAIFRPDISRQKEQSRGEEGLLAVSAPSSCSFLPMACKEQGLLPLFLSLFSFFLFFPLFAFTCLTQREPNSVPISRDLKWAICNLFTQTSPENHPETFWNHSKGGAASSALWQQRWSSTGFNVKTLQQPRAHEQCNKVCKVRCQQPNTRACLHHVQHGSWAREWQRREGMST